MAQRVLFSTASSVTAGSGNTVVQVPDTRSCTLEATGLGASEVVNIYQRDASGGYTVLAYEDGVQVQLTATGNTLRVNGPKSFAVGKSATSAAVTVTETNYMNP